MAETGHANGHEQKNNELMAEINNNLITFAKIKKNYRYHKTEEVIKIVEVFLRILLLCRQEEHCRGGKIDE
ncbi:hypothetical protein ACQKKE_08805 [Desemzia incerta]|uniref:hypothetical protein n=1 Tax=Desemzia incerta TaxID=82801 RepID=UPI003CFBCFAF